MADPEHLAKLKKGVRAWNDWRKANPEIVPDFRNVDLSEARLNQAKLQAASLHGTNFSRANLIGANLAQANLLAATLSRADLREADLSLANLTLANFITTNLGRANPTQANFSLANLSGADITEAAIGHTTFGNNDLSDVKGLETVRHIAPSTIGIDTIFNSKGKIPEVFLRGCGVPESFVTYMKSLVASASPIEFYSCFISYSSKDDVFADELHTKLQGRSVRCWFAPEDLKIGDRFQERIEESIRLYDKLLVVLSENSVKSPWVEREVQAAFEKEQRQGTTVLFPVRLDDAVMDCPRAWAAGIRRTRHIGDFRKWKDHDSFQKSLDRLLRDLKSQGSKPK